MVDNGVFAVSKAVLVDFVIVGITVNATCTYSKSAGVRTIVKCSDVFSGRRPWCCGVQQRRVEVQRHFGLAVRNDNTMESSMKYKGSYSSKERECEGVERSRLNIYREHSAGFPESPNCDFINDTDHWIVFQPRSLQLRLSV